MYETVVGRPVRPIAIVRHPLSTLFLPVPIVCFVGALLTDLAYLGSDGNRLWVNFSSWLLAAGLAVGAIAAVLIVIDVIRGIRRGGGLVALLLLLGAWIVELINSLVHARDGWTAVAGAGLILSIVGVLLVLVAGWLWRSALEVRP
jgi:uncharacterized membrane protein